MSIRFFYLDLFLTREKFDALKQSQAFFFAPLELLT